MAGWLELCVEGDARAIIKADSFIGVIMPKGFRPDTICTPKSPLRVLLHGGSHIDVFAESAEKLFERAENAKLMAKQAQDQISVNFWIDRLDRDALAFSTE